MPMGSAREVSVAGLGLGCDKARRGEIEVVLFLTLSLLGNLQQLLLW